MDNKGDEEKMGVGVGMKDAERQRILEPLVPPLPGWGPWVRFLAKFTHGNIVTEQSAVHGSSLALSPAGHPHHFLQIHY
jgi:hypothetical protein